MKRVSPLGGGISTFVELKLANTQDGAKIVQLQKSDIDLDWRWWESTFSSNFISIKSVDW